MRDTKKMGFYLLEIGISIAMPTDVKWQGIIVIPHN